VKKVSCLQFALAAMVSAAPAFAGPQITTTTLPPASTGVAYSAMLNATGGSPPYSGWTIVSGSLPPGLLLNAATGSITGTPASAPITAAFSVTVQDSMGNAAPVQTCR